MYSINTIAQHFVVVFWKLANFSMKIVSKSEKSHMKGLITKHINVYTFNNKVLRHFCVDFLSFFKWHCRLEGTSNSQEDTRARDSSVRNPVCALAVATATAVLRQSRVQWLKAALKRGSLNNAISLMSFGQWREFLLWGDPVKLRLAGAYFRPSATVSPITTREFATLVLLHTLQFADDNDTGDVQLCMSR